jgi:hypothetical protein
MYEQTVYVRPIGKRCVRIVETETTRTFARPARGVPVPAVLEAAVIALLVRDELRGVLEPVRAGHAHWGGEAIRNPRPALPLAVVHRLRAVAPFLTLGRAFFVRTADGQRTGRRASDAHALGHTRARAHRVRATRRAHRSGNARGHGTCEGHHVRVTPEARFVSLRVVR